MRRSLATTSPACSARWTSTLMTLGSRCTDRAPSDTRFSWGSTCQAPIRNALVKGCLPATNGGFRNGVEHTTAAENTIGSPASPLPGEQATIEVNGEDTHCQRGRRQDAVDAFPRRERDLGQQRRNVPPFGESQPEWTRVDLVHQGRA